MSWSADDLDRALRRQEGGLTDQQAQDDLVMEAVRQIQSGTFAWKLPTHLHRAWHGACDRIWLDVFDHVLPLLRTIPTLLDPQMPQDEQEQREYVLTSLRGGSVPPALKPQERLRMFLPDDLVERIERVQCGPGIPGNAVYVALGVVFGDYDEEKERGRHLR